MNARTSGGILMDAPIAGAGTTPAYVYGVIAAQTKAPEESGIEGAALETVVAGELAALVSDLPSGELQLGRKAITTHSRVLEQALEHGTVLPMRFGVVMEDRAAVKERLLERYEAHLREQLAQMQGKVELKLRAIYEEHPILAEVVHTHREIAALRERITQQNPDAAYYERIRLGEMIAGAVDELRQRDQERIARQLEPLAEATLLGEPSHERMVLNASFLVDRPTLEQFDAAVDEIGRQEHGRMRLKYVGPLPPHSFVQLPAGEEQQWD